MMKKDWKTSKLAGKDDLMIFSVTSFSKMCHSRKKEYSKIIDHLKI